MLLFELGRFDHLLGPNPSEPEFLQALKVPRPCRFEITERLLCGVDWSLAKPCGFRIVPPLGEHPTQRRISALLVPCGFALLVLDSQRTIENIARRTGKLAHFALLLAVRRQLKSISLKAIHGLHYN